MFDLILTGGTIVDGTGSKSYASDIGISDGKISAIGNLKNSPAKEKLDITGKLVTPGFIDIHRHADASAFLPEFGKAELSQGLTTLINGNCGLSLVPFGNSHHDELLSYLSPIVGTVSPCIPLNSMSSYLKAVNGKALNCGMLAGSGTIRADHCGFSESISEDNFKPIRDSIEKALSDGALGVSLGIGYSPDCYYNRDSFIKALAPISNSDIPLTVHMRNEGDGLLDSFEEVVYIAKHLNCPLEISHLKGIGKDNWGKTIPEVLKRIDRYRGEGLDVRFDFYPYTAGSTLLLHIIPPDVLAGGTECWKKRLMDPECRKSLQERFATDTSFENIVKLASWEGIYATSSNLEKNKPLLGKSITEIAAIQGKTPLDACCDLLVEENGEVTMIDFITSEEDIARLSCHPLGSVISDAIYPSSGKPHPRLFGTYTHFLEKQVKQKKLLGIESAVAKMTGVPASALRLSGKGFIHEGMDADLCVFELENIHENATYQNPEQLSVGMDYVLVNGIIALDHNKLVNLSGGKAVTRK